MCFEACASPPKGIGMTENIELTVQTDVGPAKLSLARTGRTFQVCDFDIPGHPDLSMAFSPKGGVEDLDGTSDMAQCFNLSSKVRYGTVVMGTTEMKASSVEELEYALKQVKIVGFNHEEI
jgi:hypothetical protein